MKFIVLLCFGSTFAESIIDNDQIEAKMEQVFSGNWAYKALDKDPKTFASGSISNYYREYATGAWWEGELKKDYTVTRVDVTNSLDPFYSPSLENFIIDINSKSYDGQSVTLTRSRCGQYASEDPLEPGQSIGLICVKPLIANSVLIRKMPNAFNPRLLTLAEVAIYHN